jgi:ATP-dependent RNA helicase DOB1
MQEVARRIAKVSQESKLNVVEDDYVKKFRPELMDVVYAWCQGAKFSQICKMTDVFEGSLIRVFRRLEELLRQMCSAAKSIGNTELENKFAEGSLIFADVLGNRAMIDQFSFSQVSTRFIEISFLLHLFICNSRV